MYIASHRVPRLYLFLIVVLYIRDTTFNMLSSVDSIHNFNTSIAVYTATMLILLSSVDSIHNFNTAIAVYTVTMLILLSSVDSNYSTLPMCTLCAFGGVTSARKSIVWLVFQQRVLFSYE